MNNCIKTTLLYVLTLLIPLSTAKVVFAQAGVGKLKGVVKDVTTKEGLAFVGVVVEQGGIQKGSATTDFEGNYEVVALTPGEYTLRAKFVGYKDLEIGKIVISPAKTTFLNVEMQDNSITTNIVTVEAETDPIIDPGKVSMGGGFTGDQLRNLPTRNIADAAGLAGGAFQRDDGSGLNIAGQRSTGSVIFVDGIKLVGSSNVPQQMIGSLDVITGGIPAMYGDAAGGVINITTRGAAQSLSITGEGVTSKFLDGYNYNLGGLTIIGPVLKTTAKDAEGNPIKLASDSTKFLKKTVLGFLLGGEIEYQKDRDPGRVAAYQINEDVLNDIRNNPYRYNASQTALLYNAEFLTKNDMYTQKIKPNNTAFRATVNGKLDYQPTELINVTAGMSADFTKAQAWSAGRSLFAYDHNGVSTQNSYRGFLRFTQRFRDAKLDSSSKGEGKFVDKRLKNVFYQLQLDYSNGFQRSYDPIHKYNLFDYGYVGNFDQKFTPIYSFNTDYLFQTHPTNDTLSYTVFQDNVGYAFTNPIFTAGTQNPYLTKYTQQAYDLQKANGDTIASLNQLAALRGLRNGDGPQSIYSLYTAPGAVNNLARYIDDRQFRFTAMGSAEYRGHNLTVGMEFEQRAQAFWAINPQGLWTYMRQRTNNHLQTPDSTSLQLVKDGNGIWTGYVNHNPLYNAAAQTNFDKKLREKLGKPVNGTEWINIDGLSPSTFSLDMFSTQELLNNGNNYITYYGYDHTGKRYKSSNQPTLSDFFTDTLNRPISALRPVYTAAYIQDKFEISNLNLIVGLRVDRFDANQKVLKNPYVLYEYYNAGEVRALNNPALVVPDNIKDDWTVYVNNTSNPTTILGYSDPSKNVAYPKYYDANGVEKSSTLIFGQNGKSAPYLKNGDKLTEGSFVDYKPQVNVMPRLAFSFPITGEALFFAHYDVLTQRPATTSLAISPLATTPVDYLYLVANATNSINNPNLRPDKTIDYALGFKTALNKTMALTVTGYYRELRNQLNLVTRSYAYPVAYQTYENVDFGTVKGFTFEYEKRASEKSNLQMNVTYTLQFADGTGSNDRSAGNLVSNGQPNLRTPLPLDFDQRHAFVVTADYRYGKGEFYRGPEKLEKILQEFGINLSFRAGSGTPYSRVVFPTRTQDASAVQRSTLLGNPNSARLPAVFRTNLRIDKNFDLKVGGGDEQTAKKLGLNVYVQVQNLFNGKNVQSVYQFSGQPDDDGYLNHAVAQSFLSQQTSTASYRDYYAMRANNPDNYGLPRRIRLGVIISF